MTTVAMLLGLLMQDDVLNKIKAMQVDLDYADTPLEEVIDAWRDGSGLNIIVDPDIDAKSMNVSIKAKSVRLQTAMRLVFSRFDLVGVIKDGIVNVTTKEKRNFNVSTRIYDIRDLTLKINDFAGPRLELVAGRSGITPDFGGGGSKPPMEPDFIIDLILAACGESSWDENPNALIALTPNGQLMVAQTKNVHEEIRELLARIREIQ